MPYSHVVSDCVVWWSRRSAVFDASTAASTRAVERLSFLVNLAPGATGFEEAVSWLVDVDVAHGHFWRSHGAIQILINVVDPQD